jgi:hypothetical protein
MPMIRMTISSSISVKPASAVEFWRSRFDMWDLVGASSRTSEARRTYA